MTARTARVTVTLECEYTADIEVDEDEYLEWLEGGEDTPDAVLEFFRAGDELEVIADVSASSSGRIGEVQDSSISDARWRP